MVLEEHKFFFNVDIEVWRCLRCSHKFRGRLDAGGLTLKEVEAYRDEDKERHPAFPLKCPYPKGCNSPYWYEPRKNEEALPLVVMMNVKMCSCIRCGNEWIPAHPTKLPKRCPDCKSDYWKRLRRQRTTKEEPE